MITSASAYGVQPIPQYEPTPVQEAVSSVLHAEKLLAYADSVRARVVSEREELRNKIFKLESFILSDQFKTVEPEKAKKLLTEQLQIMKAYSDILFERIQLLPQE